MFFNNIQALRGIASLMVFLIHLLSTSNDVQIPWLKSLLWEFGPGGVDIFFVLSGFVVTMAAMKSANLYGGIGGSISFMTKRIIRIYPLYIVVLSVAFIISPPVWLAPDWMPQYSFLKLASLTTLVNHKVMVAWSLVFEMFFYAVLSVLVIFGAKHFRSLLILWVVAQVMAIIYFNSIDIAYSNHVPLNPQIIQFCAGSLLACFSSSISAKHGRIVLVAGFVFFGLMCVANQRLGGWNALNRTITLTIPSAMIVYGAIATEIAKSVKPLKALVWLGNISFSLYLWHQITFQACEYLFRRFDLMWMNNVVILLIWSAAGLSVGTLSYYFIERKLMTIGRRKASESSAIQGA